MISCAEGHPFASYWPSPSETVPAPCVYGALGRTVWAAWGTVRRFSTRRCKPPMQAN